MRFTLTTATEVLARTPASLAALLGGLSDAWLHGTEGDGTFSPFAVVGHLIDAEQSNWIVRARQVLDLGETATLVPFDRFRHRDRDAGRAIDTLLDEFATLRAANLAEIRGWDLDDSQLTLASTHPVLGRTTLAELLSAWVVHDLGHVAQVARVMAKQYGEAIGPWRQFLPVVGDRPVPVT